MGGEHMPTSTAQKLDRKNIIIDGRKVKQLQRILHVPSESEAIRIAVDRALNAEEAITALERLKNRGTWGSNFA